MKNVITNSVICFLVLLTLTPDVFSQEPPVSPAFKQAELDQLLAPVSLYPDSLISQILMASTYPLEIVQADRWAKQNKDLSGDAFAVALEKQTWDPSVKSLVNFPQVLTMMSEKLDWTQKLGDAFLAQQKDVMNTVQKLRGKAEENGSLKTNEQQVVKNEQQTITIEPADPQVIYVPTYDPTVVYGSWPDSEYPPYDYYPPEYIVGVTPYSYGVGIAAGAAWGYAWGNCDWNGGNIDIDTSRNLGLNPNINRGARATPYQAAGRLGGKSTWQHNPADRRGVPYRDQATAQKYNRASTSQAVQSRQAYRGRSQQSTADRNQISKSNAAQSRQITQSQRPTQNRASTRSPASAASYNRASAFQGMDRGSSARNFSSRGQSSRQSMSRPSGGGFGGGRRGGGGRRR